MRRLLVVLLSCLATLSQPCAALELTPEEQAWLDAHPVLRLGVDTSWPPFEFRNAEGHHSGLVPAYTELIRKRLNIKLDPVEPGAWSDLLDLARQGKVDLLPGAMATSQRLGSLDFTRPFLDLPIVIISRHDGPQPHNLDELYGRKIAVIQDYAPHELLRSQHPDLNLQPQPTLDAAMQSLASGKADVLINDLASSAWNIREHQRQGLYVSGQTPYRYQLAMAAPHGAGPLIGILDKLFADLSAEERENLQAPWLNTLLDARQDWRNIVLYVLGTLAAVILILFAVLLINRRLSREIQQRQRLEEQLRSSEQHYRGLVESLNAIAWEMRLEDYCFTYVSPHAERLLGYPLEEWLRPGFWQRTLHPDDAERTFVLCQKETQAGRDHSFDYRMLAADGRVVWLHDIVTLTDLGHGPLLRGLMIDISETRRTQEKLAASEEKFAKAFNASPDGLLITRQDTGELLAANEGFTRLTGFSLDETLGRTTREIGLWFNLQDRDNLVQQIRQNGAVFDFNTWVNIRGQLRYCELSAQAMEIDGQPCMLTIARDVTERQQTQERLRLAATVFENTAEGVMVTDPQQRITAVNRAFTRITGYSEEDILGESPRMLASDRHDHLFYTRLLDELQDTGHWQGEIWNRRKNGESYPQWLTISAVHNQGNLTHFVSVFADISSLKAAESQLDHQAHHDPLTGLPNRPLFEKRLNESLENKQSGAVLFLDLDRFKHINDSLGHPVGDCLLQGIAQRLLQQLGANDTVARQGGDEFIVLLPEISSAQEAEGIAQRLLACFEAPFQANVHEFFISASIGICLYPTDGDDVATLVKNADAAMYRSKAKGRNRAEFYTRDLTLQATERMTLEHELRRAVERQELSLHYQPKRCLASGELIGAEALLRWTHPQLGQVPPDRFITLAEDSGLIVPIGDWVLQEACRQLQEWQAIHGAFGVISVNLSGKQLSHPQLANRIDELLTHYGLRAEHLQLEITESFIMNQAEEALDILHSLKALGVQLAIDDFGTGYSSLSYLKRMPLDILKIDKSFIAGLPDASDDAAITRSIIALARSLQLTVIAEGVETEAQQDFLTREGCQQIQGYLISKPLCAKDFADEILSQLRIGSEEKASL
ncbi:bifunctional diguanylate cyclase/phosphodiesterase [Pseudomonas sp. LRF_L74]|uniref:bifunctional diguanylate cyclase/phosphodiesterase n=1 Tax=Pseudomonas sp. LRF_L74 TaxID=3369422 RepID=UPI003F610BEA